MRTNLGQAEDRKRTYEGPHRQEVQFYQNLSWESKIARVMLHDLSVKIEIYADLRYHD